MLFSLVQIVHLKRFQFVNNRWIKSQKIVRFPRDNFDPRAFLTPRDVDQRRGGLAEELSEQEQGTVSRDSPSTPTSLNVNNVKGQLSAITVKRCGFYSYETKSRGLYCWAGNESSESRCFLGAFKLYKMCFYDQCVGGIILL